MTFRVEDPGALDRQLAQAGVAHRRVGALRVVGPLHGVVLAFQGDRQIVG
jgi:hypothetical protein